jgi:glycogen synthase
LPKAAAFGLMPSLYEPFGMANEIALAGALPIGRATGGIAQQVVPLRAAACFSPAVEERVRPYALPASAPTGLLWREPDGVTQRVACWNDFNSTGFAASLRSQWRNDLFDAMVSEMYVALVDAVELWSDLTRYARMVAAGIDHLRANFSWSRAASTYLRYLAQ